MRNKIAEMDIPESVRALQKEGKKILVISYEDKSFYFKKPTYLDIAYYKDQIYKSDGCVSTVQDKFVRHMYVGEDVILFDQFIKEKPFAVSNIINSLFKGLGGEINFIIEELEA